MLFFDVKAANGPRRLALLETAGVFLLIMLYIWAVRYTHQYFAMVIMSLIALSHRWRGETLEQLGFRLSNFRSCVREFLPSVVFLSLLLLSLGILLQTQRPVEFEKGVLGFAGYCVWGLFQQYLLNSYFLNRLTAVSATSNQAAITAAALFSGAHLPNWLLMLVTLAGGYCCAKVYLKYRNLYFLAIAHGAIGFLLYLVVPDSISHHLRVGPAWFGH